MYYVEGSMERNEIYIYVNVCEWMFNNRSMCTTNCNRI